AKSGLVQCWGAGPALGRSVSENHVSAPSGPVALPGSASLIAASGYGSTVAAYVGDVLLVWGRWAGNPGRRAPPSAAA
ncbi:MAG TPA: hypothetical protein VNG33_16025, partial [Polyangiaceae bacterium]|nr:hypothetical protein [Polyangiaceae bacterium]